MPPQSPKRACLLPSTSTTSDLFANAEKPPLGGFFTWCPRNCARASGHFSHQCDG